MNKWGECSSVGFGWVSLSNLLEVKACGLFCCGWIVLSKHVPILLPSCFCVYKQSREYTSYIYNDCLYMKYKLPIYLFFQDFCDLLCTCRFRYCFIHQTLFDLSKSKITSNLYVVIHNKTQLYCITLSTSVQQSWTLMLYKTSKQKMRPSLQQSTIRNKTTCTVLLQFYIKPQIDYKTTTTPTHLLLGVPDFDIWVPFCSFVTFQGTFSLTLT